MPSSFLPDVASPLLVAHRGLTVEGARENTVAAFEHALCAGADAVECDLRLAHDGTLVIFHDRGIGVDGRVVPVIELDASARAALLVPGWEDLLTMMEAWPSRGVVIDVKSPAAAESLFDRYAPTPAFMVISFSDLVVARATNLGWNVGFVEGFLPMILRDLTPDGAYFCPALGSVASYPELLTDAELGRSLVGVVDDVDRARELAARGVFGMTTNRVDVLRRALPVPNR